MNSNQELERGNTTKKLYSTPVISELGRVADFIQATGANSPVDSTFTTPGGVKYQSFTS